jgi:hypothetical protein
MLAPRRWIAGLLLLAVGTFPLPARAQMAAAARFVAVLEDGREVTGQSLDGWHAGGDFQLDGAPLDNATNPVSWLRQSGVPVADLPPAAVELFLGDVLPGRVVGFRSTGALPYEAEPPHLLVAIEELLATRNAVPGGMARVALPWVRRVIWQRQRSEQYQPGTALYRDGRQVKFRSVTWQDGAVRLLAGDSVMVARFDELAELHLPRIQAWEAYYQLVAALCPSLEEPLVRLECSDGLRATTSRARLDTRLLGTAADAAVQLVQPVWCLDPLSIRLATVRQWRFDPPQRFPLSSLEPVRRERRAALSRGWPDRRDRGVQGQPLRSGGRDFAFGMGVHATSELEFELPASAVAFRTRLGLDDAAGTGGCVRARIHLGNAWDAPAYESPLLIGSGQVAESGLLSVPDEHGMGSRLLLVADMAHAERPAGADPLDVRDCFDWLEPRLELDADLLEVEVRAQARRLVPAWQGWTVQDYGAGLEVESFLEPDSAAGATRARLQFEPRERFLRLSRRLPAGPQPRWLLLALCRGAGTTAATIQVEIDGEPAAHVEVPLVVGPQGPDALLVPLPAGAGSEAQVDLVQLPSGPRSLVDWRALAVVDRPPGLLRLFDEEPEFVEGAGQGAGSIELTDRDAFRGLHAARVEGGERRAELRTERPIRIREYPRLGEFRYLRFAWRKQGGERVALGLGHGGLFGPRSVGDVQMERSFRYDAGRGGAALGAALRVADSAPEQWTLVTRDLWTDFGAFELTGLSLVSPDGEAAEFDHLYLARTPQDFDWIDALTPTLATR